MMYQAIKALRMYNAEKNEWSQAHCLAAWAIFAAVRKENPTLIQFELTKLDDGREYFYMNLDRTQLREGGHKALSEFLGKLHTLKSLGDFETARDWFNSYATVDEEMLKIKELVDLHKRPRRIELQPNLVLQGKDTVAYKEYDQSF